MSKLLRSLTGLGLGLTLLLVSCGGQSELSPDEIAFQKKAKANEIVGKTIRKPGGVPFEKGQTGGVWLDDLTSDPKTFNKINANDGETDSYTAKLTDALLDYDAYKKIWQPNLASYEVLVDEKSNTLSIILTLRDDLYWTTLAEPDKKIKVTSDDVVFWYNEIDGDKRLQQIGYAGQFLEMPDGSKKHIDIEKIDERRFKFIYPKIIAMPELSSNMDFGPRYIYEPVKKEKGIEGLFNLWSVDTDPKTIPSIGPYYLEAYKPGISLTLKRNPNYWKKDEFGQTLPYIDRIELRIIPNIETKKLKFLAGEQDSYGVRPEDLDEMVKKDPKSYSVYYGGSSLGASFISWNQNPKNLAPKYVKWFSNVKFRQAMSCFFNRERIISQVYRGLAEPAIYFFAKANPYFDPTIHQTYLYNPARGKQLLAEMGITQDKSGIMRDADGNAIEYDLNVTPDNNIGIDIGNIYADELKQVGIKLNLKPIDFQKIVESVSKLYDWQSVMLGFGSNYWPTSGNNVWQSRGNFHLWYPNQEKPVTDWEARVDALYNAGDSTRNKAEAKKIWDEYQKIILDQVPVMYMFNTDIFSAYQNKWGNIFRDNHSAPDLLRVYLKP